MLNIYSKKDKDMTIQEFIDKYREAFGEAAPLPIALGYSDTPASEVGSVPKCMIGRISKVRDGEPLTLCSENILCGGGGLYTAFRPMPERVPVFVSEFDIQMGRNAGTRTCGVTYGNGSMESLSDADWIIDDFGKLLDIVSE